MFQGRRFSDLVMGCSPGRPVNNNDFDDQSEVLSDSDTEFDYEDSKEQLRVHFDAETADNLTEYTGASRMPSGYASRGASARGPRIRLGSAATGMSEYINETMTTNPTNESQGLNSSQNATVVEEEDEGEPGSHAPSLSLWYKDEEAGDILTQDVYVPKYGLTKFTYYCCLQWNGGLPGGGYCGIQDHPRGRNFIFSLWDPADCDEEIKPVQVGPGTICERFGGEGEGLKSWNFQIGWEVDCWYTLLTRRWDHDDHTYFGFWVKHQLEMEWTHMVTVDYPVADVYFETMTCSFLEDWEGSGENLRRVHFKNGFKRSFIGRWIPFNEAVFSVVREMRSKLYEENYGTGLLDDTFFLQSGGETYLMDDIEEGKKLKRKMPSRPDILPIACYITAVTDDELTWEVPSGSVPQFQFIVYVDRTIYKQEINSETRMCRFKEPPKEIVELLVEDIYGKSVRRQFIIQEEEKRERLRLKCDVYLPSAI